MLQNMTKKKKRKKVIHSIKQLLQYNFALYISYIFGEIRELRGPDKIYEFSHSFCQSTVNTKVGCPLESFESYQEQPLSYIKGILEMYESAFRRYPSNWTDFFYLFAFYILIYFFDWSVVLTQFLRNNIIICLLCRYTVCIAFHKTKDKLSISS